MSTDVSRFPVIAGRPIEVATWNADAHELTPILLLHEGLGSVGLWRDFPDRLATTTGRRVVAFSRHGHGRSGRPPQPRTPAFFHSEALDVLVELTDRLEIEDPILVGHSDGASIALIHAAAHPTIPAVVLMAPHVFVEPVTLDSIRGTRDRYRDGDLRSRMQRHHDDVDAAFWGWCDVWLDPEFERWDLDAEIDALRSPTLLIQGADDPYGSLEQVRRIDAGAPAETQIAVVPGGHSPHLEQPELVLARIGEFLTDQP